MAQYLSIHGFSSLKRSLLALIINPNSFCLCSTGPLCPSFSGLGPSLKLTFGKLLFEQYNLKLFFSHAHNHSARGHLATVGT